MSDVSVSLGVTGKDVVTGAFQEVGKAGEELAAGFESIVGKLAGLAAAYVSVTTVVGAFKDALDLGGRMSELADQTGISAGKLLVLQRAFENNGMEADTLGSIINKMQKNIAGAGDESSDAAAKLQKLGLSASEIAKMSPDEQFRAIALAINRIQDPTEKSAAAMEMFGKSGGKTLALFANFDAEVSSASGEVGSLAGVLDKSAASFDAVNDSFKEIAAKVSEFAAGILGEALPALKTLTEYLKGVDATAFGQTFSAAFSKGINIALSVFTNPGNLFLAFGDALVVAFKTAINALDNGLVYAFQFAVRFFGDLAQIGIIDLIKNGVSGAFNFVAEGFLKILADGFDNVASFLPGKLGDPMRAAGAALRDQAEKCGEIFEKNLAVNADAVSKAFSSAADSTHLANTDFMNVADSAAQLQNHADAAAQSGKNFLDSMQQSNDATKAMAQDADAMDKSISSFADRLSGASKSFSSFNPAMSLANASGLGPNNGLLDAMGLGGVSGLGGIGTTSAVDAAAQAGLYGGGMGGSSTNRTLRGSTKVAGPKLSQAEALNKTAQDFGWYFNNGQGLQMSKADVLSQLQQDLWMNSDMSPSEAQAAAEAQWNEQMTKNQGPIDSGGGSNNSSSSGSSTEPPANPMSDIAGWLKGEFYQFLKESLPVHALS